MPLLSEDLLKRLEALRLAVRRRVATGRDGDRGTSKPGGSAEFHSHRSYVQGDDTRGIDWPLYARLGQLFIMERNREEALRLHLVIDGSESMRGAKLDMARRLGAAIALVAGHEHAAVTVWEEGPIDIGSSDLLRRLETSTGCHRPVAALQRIATMNRAFLVIVGDFWDYMREAIGAVMGGGGQVSMIRVLGRDEIDPPMRGMIRAIDSETGAWADRFLGDEELAKYRALLEEDEAGWRAWARSKEISFLRCAADEDLERVLMVYLRGEGVIE